MKKSLIAFVCCFTLLAYSSNALAGAEEDMISSAEQKALNATNGILRSLTSGLTEALKEFDSVKYLDIAVEVQDTLNPAVSITNVNSIFENTNSAFFNQNTLTHNKDEQTINFGLGYRKLLNNDRLLFGANIFYDYAFDDNHRRIGAGVEVISSVLDFRSNIYQAESDVIKTTSGTTEEALDGWDARLDYHIPVGFDLRIFGTYFDWENKANTYENKGEQYGIAGQYGLVKFEAGYRDEEGNKKKDAFAKMSLVIPLGSVASSGSVSRGMMEMISVRDQLYEPVERENRIRVVKISAGNIVVSGF
jgi:adhesin/invasin|tara:strand:- start:103 stop:1017 length:915 start_codon:yes stop_codon:yes gene_type:complete